MQKNILVTGASTGIGFDTVRALVDAGFSVIATVRKVEDQLRLEQNFGAQVKVIQLDVADLEKIEALPEKIKQLGVSELHGLVNNAGAASAGPFLNQPFSEVQNMIQVNVLALMKVTQVLLPLLGAFPNSKNPGRIVNISSVAGRSAAPFLSVYAASKHAVEGFSEGLRREMMLFGIKVILVGPGSIKTPIWQKGFVVVKERYNSSAYAQAFQKFIKVALNEEKNGLPVSDVSQMIVNAMTVAHPPIRYSPIPRKWTNWYIPRLLPVRTMDRLTAKFLGLNKN